MKNKKQNILNLDDSQLETLKSAQYAQKQLFKSGSLIRWAHGARFNFAVKYVSQFKSDSIVDYGCGDGTFLLLCKNHFKQKIGFDLDPQQIAQCQSRYSRYSDFVFRHTAEFAKVENNSIKIMTCMEVLEHCPESSIDELLASFESKLASNGSLIISVPIEIGLTLCFKQLARRVLGIFKLGQYQFTEKYTVLEFFRALFATKTSHLNRNISTICLGDITYQSCGHKGFNWRLLEATLMQRFNVTRAFTPMPIFGTLLNSQIWFIVTKKSS